MLAYPLVLSDYDGTLCRDDKTIDDYTRAVIAAYRAAGGLFTVATGRMYEGILSQWAQLGIADDVPVVCCQGALIRTVATRRTLFSATLARPLAARILAACRDRGLDAQTYYGGQVIVEREFAALAPYLGVNAVAARVTADLAAFAAAHDVRKILVHLPPADFERLQSEFEREFGAACRVCRSSRTYLEFFSAAAGKENALRFLAAHYGIDPARTLAFGDHFNDLAMLRAAGYGVAVANAVPAVLAAADALAESNNRDGVARVLARLHGLAVPPAPAPRFAKAARRARAAIPS